MQYKTISWNINSITKRREQVTQLLEIERPDFLFLQETRCDSFQPFENYYNYHHAGKKGRNGVAIISKEKLEVIHMQEERYIQCKLGEMHLICVYVYNGGSTFSPPQKKIEFLSFLSFQVAQTKHCIVGGDFNVLHNSYEYWNINPYSDSEIQALKDFESKVSFFPSRETYYTWWDYRNESFHQNKGMGIDKFYYKQMNACQTEVMKKYRKYSDLGIPSDHAPISCFASCSVSSIT